MALPRDKHKGRKESSGYCNFPHALLDHENFKRLTAHGLKLLVDMYSFYNGRNNGDLSCTWKLLTPRGWKSPVTRDAAKAELQHYGLIVKTRTGSFNNRPDLFAVTWRKIDECIDKGTGNSKIELFKTPCKAPGTWKLEKSAWDRKKWETSRPKQPWKGKCRKKSPTSLECRSNIPKMSISGESHD